MPKPLSDIDPQLIDIMVAERKTLLQAAAELGIPSAAFGADDKLTPERAAASYIRRKPFRDLFAAATRTYYSDRANIASHDKTILIGKMLDNAERLSQQGKHKEASDVLAQIAKIEGWQGPESSVTIFSQLSGQDFGLLRERMAQRQFLRNKPN